MWTSVELARFIMERERQLLRFLLEHERKGNRPEPPPEPEAEPGPRFKPGSQEWYRTFSPPKAQGINMNDMLRAIPKPKPPRKPSWER